MRAIECKVAVCKMDVSKACQDSESKGRGCDMVKSDKVCKGVRALRHGARWSWNWRWRWSQRGLRSYQ